MAFIEIPVSSSILATYNTAVNRGLFVNRGTELEPSWFFRISFPDDTNKEPSEERIIHKGMATSWLEIIPKKPFLSIPTDDCRVAINDVLLAIEEESPSKIIQVYDWAWPLAKDRVNGYTVRNMVLKSPPTQLGAIFKDSYWGDIVKGWRIELEALDYD